MRILPRPFGQVLNDALASLARTWKPLTTTSIMVFLPVGALTFVVFEQSGAIDFLEAVFSESIALEALSDEVLAEMTRPFLLAAGVALVLQGIATLFVYLVAHRIVALDLRGEDGHPPAERRRAWGRFGVAFASALVALIVVTAVIALGVFIWAIPLAMVGTPNPTSVLIAVVLLVGLVAPGAWMAVTQSMLTPVLSLEDRGVLGSIRRSFSLVRGRWWPTLGFLLMVGLLGSVATQLIQLVAIPLAAVGGVGAGLILVSVAGVAAQGPIVAAMGAVYTHWYFDLRARREPLMQDQI
jgi:hypothetical protein